MPRGVYERKPDKYPRKQPLRATVMCSVAGCSREADRPKLALCETHYYRNRRHGSFELPASHWRVQGRKGRYPTTDGYVSVLAPDHPLARSGGLVLEHRKVYYDAKGDGPFSCHWCGVKVTWGTLHIDHVNDAKQDNRLANLVASCPPCNKGRGSHKSKASNQARGLNIAFKGETLPVRLWASRIGISTVSLKARLANGWPLDRALTEPRGVFGPRAAR